MGTPVASTQGLLKQWLLVKTQSMSFVQISPKLPWVHSPVPAHVKLSPQSLPHRPQLCGSTWVSVQVPLQQVSPVPQQVAAELPVQTRSERQHAPATTVNPLSQAVAKHFPPTQATAVACCTALGSQCLEQPPQFCGSLLVSVQIAVPPGAGSGQQSGVAPGQDLPHWPQCRGSMSRSTQLPPQHAGDPRVPSMHDLSHSPQWRVLLLRSTQKVSQQSGMALGQVPVPQSTS
jgi:hypothetical protein